MGLYPFSRSLVRSLALARARSHLRSQPPLLPRYLVQLFCRLKGPRYADTLFVTRESRRGCLRQASKQASKHRQAGRRDSVSTAFPPRSGNCERRGALTRTLIFRQRLSLFPSASGVSFTCLSFRRAEERAGRFQSPRGGSSTAPRRKKIR